MCFQVVRLDRRDSPLIGSLITRGRPPVGVEGATVSLTGSGVAEPVETVLFSFTGGNTNEWGRRVAAAVSTVMSSAACYLNKV